jgi:hypothetical protein
MEKVIIEAELKTGNSVSEFKTLRSQIKELKNQQAAAAQSFGEDSEEVKKYSKQLGNLIELQDDLNRSTKAFTPDNFDKAQFILNGVASGFQAATGAAALFGDQSEDVQKSLLKVQGAMALTAGIKDMADLAKTYGLFSKDTIKTVVKSLGTLRGALIATGIGAAAVAVGLLVANWDSVVKTVREFLGLGPSLKEQMDAQTKAYEEQSKIIEYNQKLQGIYIDQLTGRDKQRAQLANQITNQIIEAGKAEEEARQKLFEQRVNGDITEQEYLKKAEEEKQKRIKVQEQTALAGQIAQLELNKQFAKEDAEKKKTQDEKDNAALIEKIRWELRQKKEAREQELETELMIDSERDAMHKRQREREEKTAKKARDIMAYSLAQYEQDKNERIRIEQAKSAAMVATFDVASGLANAFSALAKQGSEEQKNIATAGAIIDGIAATQASFAQANKNPITALFPGYPYIVAAATALAAVSRVKQIQSVRVSSPSIPTISAASNPVGVPRQTSATGTTVQGAGDININSQGQRQRVYVVESDIRKVSNRVDVIESNSTIQ